MQRDRVVHYDFEYEVKGTAHVRIATEHGIDDAYRKWDELTNDELIESLKTVKAEVLNCVEVAGADT